jgi:hypothetical protein
LYYLITVCTLRNLKFYSQIYEVKTMLGLFRSLKLGKVKEHRYNKKDVVAVKLPYTQLSLVLGTLHGGQYI